jgi:hypothetical protein
MANLRVDKITSTETFDKTGSVQFDGDADYLEASNSDDFQLGTGDFTVEAWVLANDNSGSRQIISMSDGNENWQLFTHSGGTIRWNSKGTNDSGTIQHDADAKIDAKIWNHVAATRSGNTLRLFKNGIVVGTFGYNSDLTLSAGGPSIGIWDADKTSEDWQGHISNVRIIKGKALYTANFKPPMRELEVVPGTVLLACQSKTDATLEKTGKTLTVGGNAIASELTPGILTPIVKSGGGSAITGSVEFDGTGDYLTPPGGTDFTLGTENFTIECWVYPTRYGGIFQFFDSSILDDSTSGPSIGIDVNDNSWAIRYGASSTLDTTTIAKLGEWYHVAYVRNSSVTKLYLNGQEIGSVSDSTDYSANYPVIGGWYNSSYYHQGFISNFRVVKGTALYTDDFIPPTRELKKVPGTVLLCCQDSNNPLTEATGKTITGYGDLDQVYNTQLVTNGTFDSDASGWTALNSTLSVSSGQLTITNNGASNGRATSTAFNTVIGARYVLKYNTITSGGSYQVEIRESNGGGAEQAWASSTDGASEVRYFQATHNQHTVVIYSIGADGVATKYDDFYVSKVNPGKTGSNFTPQVGDDRKVTFEGVTKINSDAYFYLPTGDTESREATGTYNAGTRGIFGGGFSNPTTHHDNIQYINIASTGNAIDAGDLTVSRYGNAALASDTRAVWAGGVVPTPAIYNTIDAVEIMSTGNAFDFGDLYNTVYYPGGFSNRTRGIYSGGAAAPLQNDIGYITISSRGNSVDFGDLITARNAHSTFGSPTRGVIAGGYDGSARVNSMEYVTIATTGNGQDFGDLSVNRNYGGGCGSAIRGLVGGGHPGVTPVNTIDYVTIFAMGNAQDFGDLTSARAEIGSCSSATRGVFAGAWSPSKVNTIDFVSIQTTGNAKDFGDLVNIGVMQECGTSNGHGGLG